MTQLTPQSPTVADERSTASRLLRNPLAPIAATLTAAPLAYVTYLTISDGWLGAAKAWLAWPTFTVLNLTATAAAFVSAWLAKREFEQSTGGQRVLHAAVLTVSVVLILAFIVSALAALLILVLGAMGDSDDENDSRFRGRPHRRRRRRRSGYRNRHRSRRSRARRSRRW
ncbi:hypothetical protein [Candidatus Poriferisodalis sp.]|uniref:hypothetical protein n=1 Tax=Candidatus Poriferisodalis sp. TaxID=3101277 RepID=UPI003B0186FD